MSDIAIRLDGLLLGAVLALTALICVVVTLVGLATGRRRLAMGAAGLTGLSLVAAVALALAIDAPFVRGQAFDWLDWLIVPWLGLMAVATVRLVRAARAA